MEINRRCGNCNRYPFCEKCESASGKCNDWRKKPREMKLERKQDYIYQFEEISYEKRKL